MIVCGGTLGIFIAHSLQLKGLQVCVVEGAKLQGREQEWNISLDEMNELVELGVLLESDLDECIMTEFPVCRSGFKNEEMSVDGKGGYGENGIGYELDTPNVLNLGIAPKILIKNVMERFIESGGVVLESTPIKGVVVSKSLGAAVDIDISDIVGTAGDDADNDNDKNKNTIITSKLVLDCMGNGSPISRQ